MKGNKKFSSRFGFLMTSVGAAVGLGNIWGFPYRLCRDGGFVFLAVYIVFVFLIGVPLMFAELKLGQAFGGGPIAAYKFAGGGYAGLLGLAACFVVLCYYFHFGGLVMREIAQTCGIGAESDLFWHILFAVITFLIVLGGINGGVEKCSKFLIPVLILQLVFLSIYALTTDGAAEAVSFLFIPDPSRFGANTFRSAIGQAMFSLSLGQCIIVTFGGYLNKNEPLTRYALTIPLLDTFTALLASLVVVPLVFSTASSFTAGPSLLFDTMPKAFSAMRYGRVISIAFFIPVLFAAATSAVSMLEAPVSAFTEKTGFSRNIAAAVVALSAVLFGLPLCRDIKYFHIYELISEKILMTSCSLITCLLFFRRKRNSLPELAPKGKAERLFVFLLRFVTPAILVASTLI